MHPAYVLPGAGMLSLLGKKKVCRVPSAWSEFLVHCSNQALGELSCLNVCRC